MTITKREISKMLSNSSNLSIISAELLVDTFISILKKNISQNNRVKISGFGSFNFYNTPQRSGRNPKTKESFIITERTKVKLSISNKLKRYLN
jgi:integration host factor subunit alpha|tara:strand:+ start:1512 stop:1790 length:279 start_codon:yes stop_codon:yes gene_type:complete